MKIIDGSKVLKFSIVKVWKMVFENVREPVVNKYVFLDFYVVDLCNFGF